MRMLTPRGLVTAVLFAVTSIANAQSTTVDFVSQGVLLGMQLSVKHGERTGAVSSAQAACVQALTPKAFHGAVGEVVASALGAVDLPTANRFFATPVGQKYAKYGLLQI